MERTLEAFASSVITDRECVRRVSVVGLGGHPVAFADLHCNCEGTCTSGKWQVQVPGSGRAVQLQVPQSKLEVQEQTHRCTGGLTLRSEAAKAIANTYWLRTYA